MARWEFKLPEIGEAVSEGELVGWLVEVGQTVAEDQAICELMTDKATVTVTVPRGGVIVERRGSVGELVKVHEPIVVLDLDGAAAAPDAAPKAAAPEKPTRKRAAATETPAEPKAPDEASPDDPDLDGDSLSGEALAMRELGGTVIGEIGS